MSLAAFGAALVDGLTTFALVERGERLSRQLQLAQEDTETAWDVARKRGAALDSLSWQHLDESGREALRRLAAAIAEMPPGSTLRVEVRGPGHATTPVIPAPRGLQ